MPINNITQTISTIPPAGARGIDVQTQFVIKQEDFQDHLQGTTVTELNTLKDQLNTRIGEINSTATIMNGYADTASAGASTATTKAGEASTSASGALTSRNQAETFKNNASASASTASQWADNNYNVEVETGKYSAKHWSTVAQNATVNKVDKVTSTDNAIVRFDGVTGAVQNSAVTIDNNGNIGTGTQSFNGFGGSGFKNYIINGGFDVWQRGENFIGHGKFYADRWKEGSSTDDGYRVDRIKLSNTDLLITGQSNALKVTTTAGTIYGLNDLRTSIENPSRLVGKTVTLSYWVKSDQSDVVINHIRTVTVINNVVTGNDSIGTIVIGTSWQKIIKTFVVNSTVDISNSTASDYLEVTLSSPVNKNASMYITGVQLEEGSIATPFENRPYGLELSLCQRYCFNPKHGADGVNQVVRGDAYGDTTTNGDINFKFPVSMRIAPYLYLSGGASSLYLGYPESIQLTYLIQRIVSCNEAVFSYSVASNNTAFKHYHLYIPDASHQILFTSEL